MKIEKKPVKGEYGVGACMDCDKSTLSKNGSGLDYPYDYVYEIHIGQMVNRLCEDCLNELCSRIIIINKYKEAIKNASNTGR